MKKFLHSTLFILYLFIFQFSTFNVFGQAVSVEPGIESEIEPEAESIIDSETESAIEPEIESTTETDYADIESEIDLIAASAILIDAETGLILYSKEEDTRRYPASITKIMTALLTLEMCDDLSERLYFSRNAVFSLPRGASHIAMDEGESLTLYDALHGLLLPSANEVANALAEHIAGTNEDFALLMNKRAESLGAVDTHFVNPSGLFERDHYTTAKDMALIMQEAVKHPVFNEIIAKRRYDIQPTEKQPNVRELLNTNKLIQPGPYFNEWVVGGKTGFTDEAQHTLVTYAEQDGQKLITVVMFGERLTTFTDTSTLLEYGFSMPFEDTLIFDSSTYALKLPVYQNENNIRTQIGEVTLKGVNNLSYSLPTHFDRADIRYELSTPDYLSAPVSAGDEIGKVICYVQEVKAGEITLEASNAVYAPVPAAEPEAAVETNETAEALETAEVAEVVPETSETAVMGSLEEDYYATLVAPLLVSLGALVISVVVFIRKRRRRHTRILQFDRYSRFNNRAYRYRH